MKKSKKIFGNLKSFSYISTVIEWERNSQNDNPK
jgi:hypothetical protein